MQLLQSPKTRGKPLFWPVLLKTKQQELLHHRGLSRAGRRQEAGHDWLVEKRMTGKWKETKWQVRSGTVIKNPFQKSSRNPRRQQHPQRSQETKWPRGFYKEWRGRAGFYGAVDVEVGQVSWWQRWSSYTQPGNPSRERAKTSRFLQLKCQHSQAKRSNVQLKKSKGEIKWQNVPTYTSNNGEKSAVKKANSAFWKINVTKKMKYTVKNVNYTI